MYIVTDYFIGVTQIQYQYVTKKSLVFRDKGQHYHSRSTISPALSSRLDLSTRWKSPLHSVWCVILILFNRDCDCACAVWLCWTVSCPIYSARSYKTRRKQQLIIVYKYISWLSCLHKERGHTHDCRLLYIYRACTIYCRSVTSMLLWWKAWHHCLPTTWVNVKVEVKVE